MDAMLVGEERDEDEEEGEEEVVVMVVVMVRVMPMLNQPHWRERGFYNNNDMGKWSPAVTSKKISHQVRKQKQQLGGRV